MGMTDIMTDVKGFKERIKSTIRNLVTVKDLFFLSAGFALAVFVCWNIYNWRMNEAIFQGNIVYKNKVFSIVWDNAKIRNVDEVLVK